MSSNDEFVASPWSHHANNKWTKGERKGRKHSFPPALWVISIRVITRIDTPAINISSTLEFRMLSNHFTNIRRISLKVQKSIEELIEFHVLSWQLRLKRRKQTFSCCRFSSSMLRRLFKESFEVEVKFHRGLEQRARWLKWRSNNGEEMSLTRTYKAKCVWYFVQLNSKWRSEASPRKETITPILRARSNERSNFI